MAMETSPPQSPARTPGRAARPRLFIKEMVLRNFKSYAGEQRIGPFHKSFSAVVGPNGSGKSNVIDANMPCSVFGKRAKQMRLNKVSELIHNSSNHQNLDSAGVSVHFQEIIDLDDGNYNAVEGSDFVITRVAFRDNTSKYYINQRGSNFTDVTKLLKGKGVDLDNNRFLILQGEVEQISLMKPKAQGPHDEGFLEYLEDIIGTNQYVEKIEEAYKQLEVLNEKRTASVQMLKLAEKERDGLESAKNEAETYMLKELSLLKWQEKATKLTSDDATSRVAQCQEDVADLEKNLASEREKIKQNSQTLKEMESVYNKHVKRQEDLENNMKSCKDQFKEFERKDVKYREDLKHLKQKIKKLEDKADKVTVLIPEHIGCTSSARRKTTTPTSAWVASKAIPLMQKKPTMTTKELREKLQETFSCEIHYDMVWKGRQKALRKLHGSWEESFHLLFNWRAEVMKRLPGSVIEIDVKKVEGKVYFHRFFCALSPCIEGFKEGCRPYLSIDSSALNGRWNGHMKETAAHTDQDVTAATFSPSRPSYDSILQDNPIRVTRSRLAMLLGESTSEQVNMDASPTEITRPERKLTPRKKRTTARK